VEAERGDVITVNPGEVHDGAPADERGRWWRMIYLEPDDVHAIAGDISARAAAPEFIRPVLRDARVAGTLFQLLDGNARKAPPLAADEALCMVLGHLLTGRTSPETVGPVFVRQARQLIDDMPAEALSLAALSAACGTSRFHLLRSFARVTGLTPHAYRIQRRIDFARSLIRGGAAIADAACAAGFADQSHLTRAFAARYGLAPAAYARALAR
jgi:AraC-like DNA-binding protein